MWAGREEGLVSFLPWLAGTLCRQAGRTGQLFALVSWDPVCGQAGRTGQVFALVSWDPVCGQGGRKDWSAFCLG